MNIASLLALVLFNAPSAKLEGTMKLGLYPNGLEQHVELIREVTFRSLRTDGLKVQADAQESLAKGEAEAAIRLLQDYQGRVKSSGLDAAHRAILTRPIDARIEMARETKARTELVARLMQGTKATAPSIAYEVRAITLPADAELKAAPVKDGEVAFLKDAEMKKLMEATQSLRRVNVMQAPKVTVDFGETANVLVTDKQRFVTGLEAVAVRGKCVTAPKESTVETGMKLSVRGHVSADKSRVAVDVKYTDVSVEKVELIPLTTLITPEFEGGSQGKPVPFTQFLQVPHIATVTIEKKGLAIPSGGYAVIAGPVYMKEFREDVRIPVISELPYISDLFQKERVVKQKMRTILIVSPIVVQVPQ